jgi:hypothetical protein
MGLVGPEVGVDHIMMGQTSVHFRELAAILR